MFKTRLISGIVLVLIAFTIALAIVLRYANALQEDSDSIL